MPFIPPHQKGRCATSSTRGGMRWTLMVSLTEAPEADGQDVWAWHPDAGVKFREGDFSRRRWPTSPAHRGEHGAAVKTIVWGMPGDSGVTCGDYARVLCFLSYARLRVHRAPGIPCALGLQRAGIKEYLAQKIMRREREGVSHRHCERQRSNPSLHLLRHGLLRWRSQ